MIYNLICKDNSAGLSRDRELVKEVLEEKDDNYVLLSDFRDKENIDRRCDVNIFFEIVDFDYMPRAEVNMLFVNPEWALDRFFYDDRFKELDAILCKTRDVYRIFKHTGIGYYTGFTSQDRHVSGYEKRFDEIFHTCNKSDQKGTQYIYKAWEKYPTLPHITVVNKKYKPEKIEGLITNINEYLSEETLLKYQNEIGIHLCPSNYEGYGHYINEARSTGAVVITTDAPPMNDMVTVSDGFLMDWVTTKRRMRASAHYVNEHAIAEVMDKLAHTPVEDLKAMGKRARMNFEKDDMEFRENLNPTLEKIYETYTRYGTEQH